MYLSELFERCINIEYTTAENSASFACERVGDTLYIYFEGSDGVTDWKNNFDFPARVYENTGEDIWFAHRGFLKVWRSAARYLSPYIEDKSVKEIIIAGYSHGAALGALCFEYAWYKRADIRDKLEGWGFGSPRVFWGIHTPAIDARWENYRVIRNMDDIVTHLPPAVLGYSHVGTLIKIGERGKYSRTDAHRAENILRELRIYEHKKHIPAISQGYALSSIN